MSRQDEVHKNVGDISRFGTYEAKAEATKALAMLDLAASIRFYTLMTSVRIFTESEIYEVMRIAGVSD